jgi:hypothetical protein
MIKLQRISFVFILLSTVILTGCSGDQKGAINLTETTSKFISGNGNIVLFGKADLKGMLDKTNYKKKDEKIDTLISTEILSLERVLNLNQSIYYAVEGPMSNDGTPQATYLFLEATSDTALINELDKRGYLVEETKDFSYTENGDFAMGIKDQLVFAVVKGGQSDAKKDLSKMRKELKGDAAGGKVEEILGQEADMVIGSSLGNLYETSSTDLEKLDKKKKDELKAMVEGSYIQTTFRFENGVAEIEAKNMFSEQLMAIMPFKSDDSGKLLARVNKGTGAPMAGFAMDMDVSKMEKFVNSYSPETIDMIFQSFGMAGNMFGGLPVASMVATGQAIGIFTADKENNAMHANAFVGMSKLGSDISKDQLEKTGMTEYFQLEQTADGLNASFTFGMGENDKSQTIQLPEVCKGFGKKGVSAFLYLDNVDIEDFGMFGSFEMLEDVKYVLFNADNDGAKLVIKSKKEDVNILENSMDIVLEMFQDKVTVLNM